MQENIGPLLSAAAIPGYEEPKSLHKEGEVNVHCHFNLKDALEVLHGSKVMEVIVSMNMVQ